MVKKTWNKSPEQQMLIEDINNCIVTKDSDVDVVYEMHHGAYKMYDRVIFQSALEKELVAASKNWRTSKEKQMLIKDIEDGTVTKVMNTNAVYEMHKRIYKKYDFNKFRNNLNNLLDSIEDLTKWAEEEKQIMANTLRSKPDFDINLARAKTWYYSQARQTLQQQMKEGAIGEKTKPKELYDSKTVYRTMDSKAFSDNFYKEKIDVVKKEYWKKHGKKGGHKP
jgi:hypothetical protein